MESVNQALYAAAAAVDTPGGQSITRAEGARVAHLASQRALKCQMTPSILNETFQSSIFGIEGGIWHFGMWRVAGC